MSVSFKLGVSTKYNYSLIVTMKILVSVHNDCLFFVNRCWRVGRVFWWEKRPHPGKVSPLISCPMRRMASLRGCQGGLWDPQVSAARSSVTSVPNFKWDLRPILNTVQRVTSVCTWLDHVQTESHHHMVQKWTSISFPNVVCKYFVFLKLKKIKSLNQNCASDSVSYKLL